MGKAKEDEMKREKIGQTWSIDLIIGVIVFMLIIATFYAFIGSKSETSIENLKEDATVASTKLLAEDGSTSSIVRNGEIQKTDLDTLCDKTYNDVKAKLGIESEFCIYLEDANGNIIPCGSGINKKAGIGNNKDINISDNIRCGQVVP